MEHSFKNTFRQVFWKSATEVVIERVAHMELLRAEHVRQVRPHNFEDEACMLAVWADKLE